MIENLDVSTFKTKVFEYEKDSKSFEFKGDKPAIVSFYTGWCNICKQLAPILEKISNEYEDKVDVYTVNLEEQSEIGIKLGIQAVPTTIFIQKDGSPRMAQGNMGDEYIKNAIDTVLLNTK